MNIHFPQTMEFEKPGLEKEISFSDLKVEDKAL